MANSTLSFWEIDWNWWNEFLEWWSTLDDRFDFWNALALWLAGLQKEKPSPGGTAGPTETPELGSLLLFGSGLVGAGGYALMRVRARKRSE